MLEEIPRLLSLWCIALAVATNCPYMVACCSKELQSILSRNLGRQQFETNEVELLKHMEQLAVEFQNPAVYMQEFLDIKQTPDEGIRYFLSRLKG